MKPVTSKNQKEKIKQLEAKRLHALVFRHTSSAADERYFKSRLMEYVIGGELESFSKVIWNMIYVRNGGGKTIKYLYFNEQAQRLYIDRDFYKWINYTIEQTRDEIKKLNLWQLKCAEWMNDVNPI